MDCTSVKSELTALLSAPSKECPQVTTVPSVLIAAKAKLFAAIDIILILMETRCLTGH